MSMTHKLQCARHTPPKGMVLSREIEDSRKGDPCEKRRKEVHDKGEVDVFTNAENSSR